MLIMESKTKVTNSTTPYLKVYEENVVQKSLFSNVGPDCFFRRLQQGGVSEDCGVL